MRFSGLPVLALAGSLLVAACGGSSPFIQFTEDVVIEPEPDVVTTIPQALAGNVAMFAFDPDTGTVVIELDGIDASAVSATYVRTPALDIGNYEAYTFQERAETRHFTMLGAESADGSVLAGVVADGGQFNRYFGGGHYERTGTYVTQTSGQVTYAGNYAAVTNVNGDGSQLISDSLDADVQPSQAGRISGNITLIAEFSSNLINGRISDRVLNPGEPGEETGLADVVLVEGAIATDGTFEGGAETTDQVDIGVFGGIFGTNADSVAGVVRLTEWDIVRDGEEEYGVFVLEACDGSGSDDPECP
ncbi:MAG: transferrin-binding protein-like solute binding protein [Pseudomonadota bacterium]